MATQTSPHESTPSDTIDFYAAVGRLAVSWGRLEGHFTHLAMEILDIPAALKLRRQTKEFPTDWKDRKLFWKKAFSDVPELSPMQDAALSFIQRVMQRAYSRRLVSEAMWSDFAPSAQPAIKLERIHPRKKDISTFEIESLTIPVAALLRDAEEVNALNAELYKFDEFVRRLSPK